MSLRDSSKRTTFDLMENNIPGLVVHHSGQAPTPRNKALSMKNTFLINEIEIRKRETEKQKEKLSERREFIMKSGRKNLINK
jgi:hypothetical protein